VYNTHFGVLSQVERGRGEQGVLCRAVARPQASLGLGLAADTHAADAKHTMPLSSKKTSHASNPYLH
jgi:hypothetical protein